MSAAGLLDVDGRQVKLTTLDRVLYPSEQMTKADVITYYVTVAARVLPHLVHRPVTRIRWPHGVGGERFFEKQLPSHAPPWLERLTLHHSDGPITYPVASEAATLVWLAQHNALELHVPQWRWLDEARLTDRLVLDLDPGPGVGLVECAEVAGWLRGELHDDGLPSVPVTSGSKGLHVYARWAGERQESTSEYARRLAGKATKAFPQLVTPAMAKRERQNRVFIDWSQNNRAKTTITPYSLRGREHPFCAAPRTWEEVADPELAQLHHREVVGRLAEPDPMSLLL
jgi:bifunctional non-homologous end joining protein LigD